jgi:hypothetical protein
VRDSRGISSRNNGAGFPRAQNVQVIGNGVFEDYERMKLDLRHVVSSCLSLEQECAVVNVQVLVKDKC